MDATLSFSIIFELAFIPQLCYFCQAEAMGNTTPPLCPKHLDIVIIVNCLQRHNLDVSLENALWLWSIDDPGWTITKADLETMFPKFIEQTGKRK